MKDKLQPWSFAIVFDEGRARANGYDVEVLYDYVERAVVSHGVERVGRGTFRSVPGRDPVMPQSVALGILGEQAWVTDNASSITYREGGPEHDLLAELRR